MELSKREKFHKFISIFIIVAISYSFCVSFSLTLPFYNLIGKSDKEKMLEMYPEYYGLLFFASDIMKSQSTVLFFEHPFYLYAQPVYYPDFYCDYYPYNESTTDEQILDFIKINSIDYILVFYINFPLSINTTYFQIYHYNTQYLLEVNRTAFL